MPDAALAYDFDQIQRQDAPHFARPKRAAEERQHRVNRCLLPRVGQHVAADADLSTVPLAVIEAEMGRLAALFSADRLTQKQFTALSERINKEHTALAALEQKLVDAQDDPNRRRKLQADREAAYERALQAIIDEQSALEQMYAPWLTRLTSSSRTLRFSVRRITGVEKWAIDAEGNLLDRRKSGPFYGVGAFTDVARTAFLNVWETGTAADVRAAMTAFMASH